MSIDDKKDLATMTHEAVNREIAENERRQRTFAFRDDSENMPCILRGNKCPQYDLCADRRLACRAYADYIYYGKARCQRGYPEPTHEQFKAAENGKPMGRRKKP